MNKEPEDGVPQELGHGSSENTTAESKPRGDFRTLPSGEFEHPFPDAVAARVGSRNVWIADKHAITPENLERLNLNPEWVVSVNRQSTAATTDHHPLRDGYMNEYPDFVDAVTATRKRIQTGDETIVNCSVGVSRSATVIATSVAAAEGKSFSDVIKGIRENRERANPHLKLRFSAFAYLACQDDRPEELRDADRERVNEVADKIREDSTLDTREEARFDATMAVVESNS